MRWIWDLWSRYPEPWGKWWDDKTSRKPKRLFVAEGVRRVENQWKYFSESEVKGLSKDLVFKLDRARDLYGLPVIITSGFRTPEENELAGGVQYSSHLTGLGCDIKAPLDTYLREKLTWALGRAGFDRIGSYSRHFHVDIDYVKPSPTYFFGDYK